jgi:hypothetical protein
MTDLPSFDPAKNVNLMDLLPRYKKGSAMKQFRVRVEKPCANWHAMEIHMQAENIIEAAERIMDKLSPLGVSPEQVTKLVEVDSANYTL